MKDWLGEPANWLEVAQRANYRAGNLARLLDVSLRQLERGFKDCNRAPQDWLDEVRIWKAIDLLAQEVMPKNLPAELVKANPIFTTSSKPATGARLPSAWKSSCGWKHSGKPGLRNTRAKENARHNFASFCPMNEPWRPWPGFRLGPDGCNFTCFSTNVAHKHSMSLGSSHCRQKAVVQRCFPVG